MSENFVENHTSTEGAPSWEPSIDLCEKIGNNPPNHPTHISLGSHIVCTYTTGSRCATESVSDYSPTADNQMIPSALSRQNELPGLPACFEERGVFFAIFQNEHIWSDSEWMSSRGLMSHLRPRADSYHRPSACGTQGLIFCRCNSSRPSIIKICHHCCITACFFFFF